MNKKTMKKTAFNLDAIRPEKLSINPIKRAGQKKRNAAKKKTVKTMAVIGGTAAVATGAIGIGTGIMIDRKLLNKKSVDDEYVDELNALLEEDPKQMDEFLNENCEPDADDDDDEEGGQTILIGFGHNLKRTWTVSIKTDDGVLSGPCFSGTESHKQVDKFLESIDEDVVDQVVFVYDFGNTDEAAEYMKAYIAMFLAKKGICIMLENFNPNVIITDGNGFEVEMESEEDDEDEADDDSVEVAAAAALRRRVNEPAPAPTPAVEETYEEEEDEDEEFPEDDDEEEDEEVHAPSLPNIDTEGKPSLQRILNVIEEYELADELKGEPAAEDIINAVVRMSDYDEDGLRMAFRKAVQGQPTMPTAVDTDFGFPLMKFPGNKLNSIHQTFLRQAVIASAKYLKDHVSEEAFIEFQNKKDRMEDPIKSDFTVVDIAYSMQRSLMNNIIKQNKSGQKNAGAVEILFNLFIRVAVERTIKQVLAAAKDIENDEEE